MCAMQKIRFVRLYKTDLFKCRAIQDLQWRTHDWNTFLSERIESISICECSGCAALAVKKGGSQFRQFLFLILYRSTQFFGSWRFRLRRCQVLVNVILCFYINQRELFELKKIVFIASYRRHCMNMYPRIASCISPCWPIQKLYTASWERMY